MLMPVVVPDTFTKRPSREPVMTIVGVDAASGVTAFDGSEASDQLAPVNAFTVKVTGYAPSDLDSRFRFDPLSSGGYRNGVGSHGAVLRAHDDRDLLPRLSLPREGSRAIHQDHCGTFGVARLPCEAEPRLQYGAEI